MYEEAKIKEVMEMGVPQNVARHALKLYNWNVQRAVNAFWDGEFKDYKGDETPAGTSSAASAVHPTVTPNPGMNGTIVVHGDHHVGTGGINSSDYDRAIALSLEEQNKPKKEEKTNMLDLQLDDQSLPRGLKNLGNTCFVNCLMQLYFYLTPLRDKILGLEEPKNKLISQLQELFANLLYSEKRYYNPRALLAHMSDEKVLEQVGVQEDINEVNEKLLTHLEEAEDSLRVYLKTLFYGSFVTTMSSSEEDKSKIERKTKESFNHLHINISNELTSLYYSLNALTSAETIEFTTDKGFKTTAERISFIERAPPVILFQLKRSFFNKDMGMTVKINKAYNFPDQIYLDRYLNENREEILKRRDTVNKHKGEIRILRDQLKKFQYKKNDGPALIQDTMAFLSQIGRGQGVVKDGLAKIHEELENHVNSLKKEVKEYEWKIDTIFNDWKKEKYVLYGIVVHEGTTVNMGHYTTYIKYNNVIGDETEEVEGEEEEEKNDDDGDNEEKKEKEKEDLIKFNWCKFNDTNVTLMEEKSVYENLKVGNRSAYCLLYVSEEFARSLSTPNKPFQNATNNKEKEQEQQFGEEEEKKKNNDNNNNNNDEEENVEIIDDPLRSVNIIIDTPSTPIMSPVHLASPIDFGINMRLREKVIEENKQFRIDLEIFLENEKKEVEEEKLKFVERFKLEKSKLSKTLKGQQKKHGLRPREIMRCDVDERVSNLPLFYSLLLNSTKNEVVDFELSKIVFDEVIKRKKINTFDDMLKLGKIKRPDENKMKELRDVRENFMEVTRYIAKAVSFLNREDYNLQMAIITLRLALAVDNKFKNKYIRSFDVIVEYLSVCMGLLFETGISLFKDSRRNCIEYFQSYANYVGLVYESERFRDHLKNVVSKFFDSCYYMEDSHRFDDHDCKFVNERIIPIFQQLSRRKKGQVVVLKETKAQINYPVTTGEYRSMTDKALSTHMKTIREQLNKKHYNSIHQLRWPLDSRHSSFISSSRRGKDAYASYTNYFKPKSQRRFQHSHHSENFNNWGGNYRN